MNNENEFKEFEEKFRMLYNSDERDNKEIIKDFLAQKKLETDFTKLEKRRKNNLKAIGFLSGFALLVVLITLSFSNLFKSCGENTPPTKKDTISEINKPIKHIYVIGFEKIDMIKVLTKIRNDYNDENFNYHLILTSKEVKRSYNLQSNDINFENADFDSFSSLLKNVCLELPNDSQSVNTLYLIGNFPEVPNIEGTDKIHFTNENDYKTLTKNGKIKIVIFYKNKYNAVTDFVISKLKKIKQNRGIEIEIEEINIQ